VIESTGCMTWKGQPENFPHELIHARFLGGPRTGHIQNANPIPPDELLEQFC